MLARLLGQGEIDNGTGSLLRVVDHVDTRRHGKPVFMAVNWYVCL